MATIYKRGQTYWIKWYEDGEPKYESLKTKDKKEALTAKAAKELDLHTGRPKAADANITVKEFARRYLTWRAGEYPNNWPIVRLVERSIIADLGSNRLVDLHPQQIEAWKRQRKDMINPQTGKPRARATVNMEINQLKAIMGKAVEWGVISHDPIAGVKRFKNLSSKPRRYYTHEELELIYQTDPKTAPLWKFLANTGLRINEACYLRWKYVTPTSVRVVSDEVSLTKSRKWREVPLSPGAREALAALANDTEYVFPTRHQRNCQRWFQQMREKAGIEGTVHELRHTFISHLVMQGVPLRTVQVLAGHSTITVTEKYSHLAPDHMAAAVSGLAI